MDPRNLFLDQGQTHAILVLPKPCHSELLLSECLTTPSQVPCTFGQTTPGVIVLGPVRLVVLFIIV